MRLLGIAGIPAHQLKDRLNSGLQIIASTACEIVYHLPPLCKVCTNTLPSSINTTVNAIWTACVNGDYYTVASTIVDYKNIMASKIDLNEAFEELNEDEDMDFDMDDIYESEE